MVICFIVNSYHLPVSESVYIILSLTYRLLVSSKMRAKYINISVHEDLAKEIDKYMKSSKLGFRSRAEVVSHAVRLLFERKG